MCVCDLTTVAPRTMATMAFFAGFQRNREFIITQHPMENTIMEFWQMMWDHNAQTIVMLTQCDEVRFE